jgi:hypothetical protein
MKDSTDTANEIEVTKQCLQVLRSLGALYNMIPSAQPDSSGFRPIRGISGWVYTANYEFEQGVNKATATLEKYLESLITGVSLVDPIVDEVEGLFD